MLLIDPVRLARRQIEIDRVRTARYPHLLAQKVQRMTLSPLALLRGSAPLFYQLLDQHPGIAEGPKGQGWLVGDAHVENFGSYRAGKLTAQESQRDYAKEPVVFDLNDFDDAIVGSWRFDVLRLSTSLLLAARQAGADGCTALRQCDAMLDAYVAAAFHARRLPPPPRPVTALVDTTRARTRKQLLDARTEVVSGRRRFTLGPRYRSLSPKLRKRAEKAFAKYAKRLPKAERHPPEAMQVLDAAFRVAGTGSLGCLRVAVLVRGKGGADGAWIFDMKAEGRPSGSRLGRPVDLEPGERVCQALDACLVRPPRMTGTAKLDGESMFVRRLSPQEDKLDWSKVAAEDLVPLARYMGALLGSCHRRGATRAPKSPWTHGECNGLRDRAILMAGIHEAFYLAYCDLVRR